MCVTPGVTFSCNGLSEYLRSKAKAKASRGASSRRACPSCAASSMLPWKWSVAWEARAQSRRQVPLAAHRRLGTVATRHRAATGERRRGSAARHRCYSNPPHSLPPAPPPRKQRSRLHHRRDRQGRRSQDRKRRSHRAPRLHFRWSPLGPPSSLLAKDSRQPAISSAAARSSQRVTLLGRCG